MDELKFYRTLTPNGVNRYTANPKLVWPRDCMTVSPLDFFATNLHELTQMILFALLKDEWLIASKWSRMISRTARKVQIRKFVKLYLVK